MEAETGFVLIERHNFGQSMFSDSNTKEMSIDEVLQLVKDMDAFHAAELKRLEGGGEEEVKDTAAALAGETATTNAQQATTSPSAAQAVANAGAAAAAGQGGGGGGSGGNNGGTIATPPYSEEERKEMEAWFTQRGHFHKFLPIALLELGYRAPLLIEDKEQIIQELDALHAYDPVRYPPVPIKKLSQKWTT